MKKPAKKTALQLFASKGGKASAASMTPEERKERALKAAAKSREVRESRKAAAQRPDDNTALPDK